LPKPQAYARSQRCCPDISRSTANALAKIVVEGGVNGLGREYSARACCYRASSERTSPHRGSGARLAVSNKLEPLLRQQGFEVAAWAILGRAPPKDAFVHSETASGLPAGYTSRVIQLESGGDPNAQSGSHSGLGQFSPEAAKRYGISNPSDVTQVSNGC
jgi:hypothetical protein